MQIRVTIKVDSLANLQILVGSLRVCLQTNFYVSVNMTSTDNGNVYYSEIAVGIDLLWNNKLDKAEEYFGKLKDTNPRYALHFAEVKITPQI